MLPKFVLIRNLDFKILFEAFLISAVSSILSIRLYLHLTNYPQVGSGGLHIAHMLWGGLLMLISIVLSISVLNRGKYLLISILGGVGFGTFIDELGKFITRDNNYFFEPTVSLIYIIFIILYLSIQVIEKTYKPNPTEYLANALKILTEATYRQLDSQRLENLNKYLSQVDASSYFKQVITELIPKIKIKSNEINQIKNIYNLLSEFYKNLVNNRFFSWLIIILFSFQALYILVHIGISSDIISNYLFPRNGETIVGSINEIGTVIFSALSGFFIIIGIFRLLHSRLAAYQLFKISMLINIFLVQFFEFYNYQFEALISFFFNLTVLFTLNFMITREKYLISSY